MSHKRRKATIESYDGKIQASFLSTFKHYEKFGAHNSKSAAVSRVRTYTTQTAREKFKMRSLSLPRHFL